MSASCTILNIGITNQRRGRSGCCAASMETDFWDLGWRGTGMPLCLAQTPTGQKVVQTGCRFCWPLAPPTGLSAADVEILPYFFFRSRAKKWASGSTCGFPRIWHGGDRDLNFDVGAVMVEQPCRNHDRGQNPLGRPFTSQRHQHLRL